MRLPRHTRDHPLQFLIYLEWILLALLILVERSPHWIFQLPRIDWMNDIGIGVIALSSFWVPPHFWQRIVYIVAIATLMMVMLFMGGISLFFALCLVLVIRSCFLFQPRVCVVVTGFTLVLCIWAQSYRFQFLSPDIVLPVAFQLIWFTTMLGMGLTLIFLQLLMFTAISERESRKQLQIANAKLRQYALEIENLAIEQERNRIAREIHDSLGHSLTVFNLHLAAALRLLDSNPVEARDLLTEAKALSATALQAVRQSVTALRSDPLQGQSLAIAIAALCQDFQRSTGITPNLHYAVDTPLSTKGAIAIYRIVQEALTNICKYAQATQVTISIQTVPSHTIAVQIQDNGQGFDATQTTTGFGLQGMQERTLALAGHFTVTTAPQAGCCIEAILPLDSAITNR